MRLVAFAVAAALCVTAAAAQQRAQPAAATIHARQAHYKQMAAALKGMSDELKASRPSPRALARQSAVIARYAPLLLRWFPHGTGPEAGVRTRARPEIWRDHDGFTRAGATLVVAARAVDAAARRGDVAGVRAALPRLRSACSTCHDDFRAPEE